jgi:hypothetical protein
MNMLRQRLSNAADASPPEFAISLVFIESGLWSRFEPGPRGLDIIPHVSGPREHDVVLFTSEGSIAAMLDDRLPASVALARGLIVIKAEGTAHAAIERLILAAFDPATPAHHESGRSAPVRLFGPAR